VPKIVGFLGDFPGNFWAVFRRLLCWFCVSDLATLGEIHWKYPPLSGLGHWLLIHLHSNPLASYRQQRRANDCLKDLRVKIIMELFCAVLCTVNCAKL